MVEAAASGVGGDSGVVQVLDDLGSDLRTAFVGEFLGVVVVREAVETMIMLVTGIGVGGRGPEKCDYILVDQVGIF